MQPPNPTAIVGPPVIHHGTLNASHTSAVALVYLTSSLPTPWPFYLASMGLSLLTVLLTLFISRLAAGLEPLYRWAHNSVVHHRGYHPVTTTTICPAPKGAEAGYAAGWRRVSQGILHIPLLIITARTAGTLSLASRVVMQHGDARRPALSTITALFVSLLPNANGNLSHFALGLAAADVIVLFVCACIVCFVGAGSNASVGYGDLAAIGGAGGCPLNLPADKYHSGFVGCGLDSVGEYANAFDGGPLGFAEFFLIIWPAVLYGGAVLAAVVIVLFELIFACAYLLSLCGRCRDPFNHNNSTIDRHNDNLPDDDGADDITLNDYTTDGCANASPSASRDQNNRKGEVGWLTDEKTAQLCGMVIFGIILYTVILFPINYVQQTRHRTITVFDSVGPLMRASDVLPAALNGTSWSDWFHVAQPADRFGFMAAWWREHGRRWDTWLAFL
jgi:hypothetical protein